MEGCRVCDNCVNPLSEQIAPPRDWDRPVYASLPSLEETKARAEAAEPGIEEGAAITVPQYGTGPVSSVEGDKVRVVFPEIGEKTFKRDAPEDA